MEFIELQRTSVKIGDQHQKKRLRPPVLIVICLLIGQFAGISNDLFPMFPRKNGVFPKVLGTNLLNDDNDLDVFFGFVSNVPKIFEQYPEESSQRVLATRPWFMWLWNV